MEKYRLMKEIGDGTFGTVYEAIIKTTGEKVAIKFMKDKINSIEECLELTEVKALQKFNHENIIRLIELIYSTNGKLALVFEFCDCNLYEFTEVHHANNLEIPEQIISEIIYQILNGLSYFHSNNYFHRDMKPENILIKLNGYRFDQDVLFNINKIQVKISDLGTLQKNKNDTALTDYICTRWYRAPECLLRTKNYNEKIDIWAVGCVMAELYLFKPLFEGDNEIDQLHKIISILGTPTKEEWPKGYELLEQKGISLLDCPKQNLKNLIPRANDSAIKIIEDILQFDDAKRPSCTQLMGYSFFTENKNKILMSENINVKMILENNNNISNYNNNIGIIGMNNNNYKKILYVPNFKKIYTISSDIDRNRFVKKNSDIENLSFSSHYGNFNGLTRSKSIIYTSPSRANLNQGLSRNMSLINYPIQAILNNTSIIKGNQNYIYNSERRKSENKNMVKAYDANFITTNNSYANGLVNRQMITAKRNAYIHPLNHPVSSNNMRRSYYMGNSISRNNYPVFINTENKRIPVALNYLNNSRRLDDLYMSLKYF